MPDRSAFQQAQDYCESLSEADDLMTRELFSRIADKWSLWALAELAAAAGPLRFSRVMERVEGVSQKSLTKTLRLLERDGLVTRTMYLEVPPRVEYAVTPLGLQLMEQVQPLYLWVARLVPTFRSARESFDGRRGNVLEAAAPHAIIAV